MRNGTRIGYNYINKNMKDTLILEGKNYISARRAARVMNYAQDYIGQLCRSGKIDCRMVGRSWFVTEESLIAHRESAIDATDERASKMLKKKFTAKVIPEVSAIPSLIPESIPSPIIPEKTEISSLKYESHNGPTLPEIKKRVPEKFNINNIFDKPVYETPIVAVTHSAIASPISINKLPSKSSLLLVAIAVVIAFTGYTLSSSSITTSRTGAFISYSQASVGTFFSNLFGNVSSYFASYFNFNNNKGLADNNVKKNLSESVSDARSNGIAIIPSSNSIKADEEEKIRVRDTFSDEVKVKADDSGTAGIITPVFKKTNGDDFLYVLVPVKEDKNK